MSIPSARLGLPALLGVGLILTGCTSRTPDEPSTAAATPASSGSGSAGATTPPPTAPSTAVTAGPLSQANVLPAPSLGSAWTTNASPAPDVHGQPDTSWLSVRDPADVTAALAPLGCVGLSRPPSYPTPQHALQGRYATADGRNAVVLVLDYRDEATATTVMSSFARDIANCPPRAGAGPQSPYTRIISVTESTPTRIQDHWTESGVGAGPNAWYEVVVRQGARLGLVDVESPPGVTPDLTTLAGVLDRTVRS
jgi:hypothetical protein